MTHYAWPMSNQINNATMHFIKTIKKCLIHNRWKKTLMKMQHCSISVTLWLTYTGDRCVKKLVRPWQFTAAVCFYILLTQSVVRTLQRMLPVNMQVGQRASTHDPYDPSKKLTHLTHWPMTHRPIVYYALPLSLPAENLLFSQSRSTVDSLPPSGINPRTVFRYRFVWANRFLFSQKFITITFSGFVPCARLNCLTVIFWAHAKKSTQKNIKSKINVY